MQCVPFNTFNPFNAFNQGKTWEVLDIHGVSRLCVVKASAEVNLMPTTTCEDPDLTSIYVSTRHPGLRATCEPGWPFCIDRMPPQAH